MKISKNNYSPNDRFLIKIFMKIISLDSSQRVPPMSPCPPLIITTVCPWLINPLSDPWDFNKSNGILLRSNWRKPYPKFYGSEFYGSGCVYLGVVKKTSQKVLTYLPTPRGGVLIRCWHYIYIIFNIQISESLSDVHPVCCCSLPSLPQHDGQTAANTLRRCCTLDRQIEPLPFLHVLTIHRFLWKDPAKLCKNHVNVRMW